MLDDDALRAAARAWMSTDPDPETARLTAAWLDADDLPALRAAFGERLAFGTAGLRGEIGPGPARMNRALVRGVTAGFARYLLDVDPACTTDGVVVGFDGRMGSRVFADDVAAVFAQHGIPAFLFDEVVPTPRLAYAIPALGAAAGVMVTASHNPPKDNGYKAYWRTGGQIVPPHDAGISAAIDALEAFDPRDVPSLDGLREQGLVRPVPAEVTEAYFAAIAGLRVHRDLPSPSPLKVVYTALHGVGTASVRRALHEAGYVQLHVVPEQAEPDGAFPTVAFPNPEEPGALDLSIALADEVGADLIVANDPDADRLAVCVPEPTADGGSRWRQLTGNEVGCLLADDLLAQGTPPERGGRMVATTIVSSRLLQRIARRYGAAYADTLTGFKWLADRALAFESATGGHFVLGYEEAIGYSAGNLVRDKDGVSAVLLFCDLAAACQQQGITVLDLLAELYRSHGLHASRQRSLKLPGAEGRARIDAALASLRAHRPTHLAGEPVFRVQDVLSGEDHDLAAGTVDELELPASNVLAFGLEDGSRVLVRPSGTEPKIKFYVEVVQALDPKQRPREAMAAAEQAAQGRMTALLDDVVARAGLA